jgi:succinate dehydrogenase / fumarate reductase, membrane anchor subunit
MGLDLALAHVSLRSPLGRVLGTGSAKEGSGRWWAERLSAVALIPLTLWFFFSLLLLPELDYLTVHSWLSVPMSSFLAMLLIAVLTYHSYLGTMVVVEDYVHTHGPKLFWLLLLRFGYVLCGGAGIFAVLRIAFGS